MLHFMATILVAVPRQDCGCERKVAHGVSIPLTVCVIKMQNGIFLKSIFFLFNEHAEDTESSSWNNTPTNTLFPSRLMGDPRDFLPNWWCRQACHWEKAHFTPGRSCSKNIAIFQSWTAQISVAAWHPPSPAGKSNANANGLRRNQPKVACSSKLQPVLLSEAQVAAWPGVIIASLGGIRLLKPSLDRGDHSSHSCYGHIHAVLF